MKKIFLTGTLALAASLGGLDGFLWGFSRHHSVECRGGAKLLGEKGVRWRA